MEADVKAAIDTNAREAQETDAIICACGNLTFYANTDKRGKDVLLSCSECMELI